MRINLKGPGGSPLFNSFIGLLDIKLGAEIVLLFGLINKVAGLYGLITVLVGGSFVQLLYYAYSTATLFAFLWGLRVVKSESSASTLLLAHLYTLDHAIASLFHYIFYLNYWFVVPHDGRRTINSQAQQDLIDLARSRGEIHEAAGGAAGADGALDDLRAALAGEIWEREKGFALWTLVAGFAIKIYFILLLYSYAAHLASSTYHTLPLTSRGKATQIAHPDPSPASQNLGRASQDDELEMQHAERAARGEASGSASASASAAGPSGSGSGNGSGAARGREGDVAGKKKVEAVDDEDFSWD
ncbi:hypothetical protein IAT38_004544 [Cryptococcus sp. DSM 104549]